MSQRVAPVMPEPDGSAGLPYVDDDAVVRQTREIYSAWASTYVPLTSDYDRYPGLREEVIRFLQAVPPGRLLDIGCGSGRDARLGTQLGHIPVLADSSMGILRHVKSTTAGAAVCCDVLNLPFVDSTFTGAIASGVLLHLPKRLCRKAIVELTRVLTDDGLAAISMKQGAGEGWRVAGDVAQPRWFAYYHPDDFAETCGRAGLAVLAVNQGRRRDWFTVTARKA